MPRTRSTQKLPIRSVLCRAIPRISAIATARPTAAEAKFCTVSPTDCTVYPAPASPEYDCQLVFVVKETAVLSAVCQSIDRPSDHGSQPCTMMSTKSATTETTENATTETAYPVHRCSVRGSTPTRRYRARSTRQSCSSVKTWWIHAPSGT